jgi:hypothetical protein
MLALPEEAERAASQELLHSPKTEPWRLPPTGVRVPYSGIEKPAHCTVEEGRRSPSGSDASPPVPITHFRCTSGGMTLAALRTIRMARCRPTWNTLVRGSTHDERGGAEDHEFR